MSDKHFNYWNNDYFVNPSKVNFASNWCDTDNEENFKKNPKVGYSVESIFYKFNSFGYRTKEFNFESNKPSILCLGCSSTVGIGVNYEESWPAYIEKQFSDHDVYNLGVSGGSCDTVIRILANIKNFLNPEIVFILWPNSHRYEIYQDIGVINLHPTDRNFTLLTTDDSHFFNIMEKNYFFASCLSKLYGYEVISVDMLVNLDAWSKYTIQIPMDTGRDSHQGVKWHQFVAGLFLKKYNDNFKI